jgi:spermidine synthase
VTPYWLLPALALLFFGSGICALVYQVLWLRLLGLTFGVTTYAASTVWASFMAGLAIGSILAGKVGDRVRSPLRWFGIAEMLIGATALATPLALAALQRVYVAVHPSLPDSLAFLTFVRFLIAFGVLIVPTALMGATLPLVVKSSVFQSGGLGSRIGLLYGTNTAGAIIGTLAAGLYLIPAFGIRGTFFLAATLNLIVGALAVVAAGALRSSGIDQPLTRAAAAQDRGRTTPSLDSRTLRVVLIVFTLSGFTSLALEVIWFRVLTLFLRPTVYGFALMLATVLAGIAIGSYLVTPFLERRWRWVTILAMLQVALGAAAIRSFNTLAEFPTLAETLRPALARVMAEWLVYPLMGSLLAILPAALVMGLAFPIGLRLWTAGAAENVNDATVAQRVGLFYSLNVGGSILGSLAAGFLLLPYLGSRTSLILMAAVTVASGLMLLSVSELRRTHRFVAGAAACLLFAAMTLRSHDPFDQFIAQRYPNQKVLWKEEGVEATVLIHEAANGERSLSLNGNHQASTGGGMVGTHRSIGHLPMVLHPAAREVLVIGLGGGATAGAVSIHDGVRVDVVELAGAVAHGASFLDSVNSGVLSRSNVRLHIDDGRNYMLLTKQKYDVITADVILPIYAGSGNLYSREYFTLMRNTLKPGGLVLQWVAGTDAEYKAIARTFLSVFPQTTVWRDGTLLVGTLEPFKLKRSDFDWKLQVAGRAQGLKELGIETFEQLRGQYLAGPEDLRAFVGEGPILTDDRPLVEYFLSLPRDKAMDLTTLRGDASRIVSGDSGN